VVSLASWLIVVNNSPVSVFSGRAFDGQFDLGHHFLKNFPAVFANDALWAIVVWPAWRQSVQFGIFVMPVSVAAWASDSSVTGKHFGVTHCLSSNAALRLAAFSLFLFMHSRQRGPMRGCLPQSLHSPDS
jgi:hypothetical protein